MIVMFIETIVAVTLAGLLALCLELGFRMGRYAVKRREAPNSTQIGALQGATLGLLGLLLGFSFAGASTRFFDRQDLVIREANTIGTAYLRADFIDDPFRTELRAALAEYRDVRLDVARNLRVASVSPEVVRHVESLHGRMWSAVSRGAAARPAVMITVVPPVNDLIDLHTTRMAAASKHLPRTILSLLVVSALLAVAVIGYGCGLIGRRCLAVTTPLAALVGVTLLATIDLDYPRLGIMQVSDAPLRDLRLEPDPATP